MNTISFKKISIVDLDVDAIVNAANEGLQAGGGVCGAIFRAAGHDQLQAACDKIGHCDTGSAVITCGFKLKAKYVIHAVGPVWQGGKRGEPELLYSAYFKSLELAAGNGCRSIGFPLISAGIYGYPLKGAWYQALKACGDFLDQHPEAGLDIVFAVLSDEIIETGRKVLSGSNSSRYKIADRNDWTTQNMPEQHAAFILRRPIPPEQMAILRRGHIPMEMEDKWFWYMEGDTLYAHRSWTGMCVYRVDFQPDGDHIVAVNRDPQQYRCDSTEEDAHRLNDLLDWWTQSPYDHYSEWIAETVDMLKLKETIPDKLKVAGQQVEAFFFHKPKEPNGYLSNWYKSSFELDGVRFSSAEQYIMYRKCMIFGDDASANAVIATEDPAEQQAIGRRAAGYIDKVWAGMRQQAAFRGLYAKFSQNDDLKKKLLDTADAWLVECAHSDTVWACGIRLDDEARFDASNWRGQNLLGFTLMQVREELKNDSGS